MDNTLTECAAVDETVVFLNYFGSPRSRQQGKVCYPLEESFFSACWRPSQGRRPDLWSVPSTMEWALRAHRRSPWLSLPFGESPGG